MTTTSDENKKTSEIIVEENQNRGRWEEMSQQQRHHMKNTESHLGLIQICGFGDTKENNKGRIGKNYRACKLLFDNLLKNDNDPLMLQICQLFRNVSSESQRKCMYCIGTVSKSSKEVSIQFQQKFTLDITLTHDRRSYGPHWLFWHLWTPM